MEKARIQHMIETANTAGEMTVIAQTYLDGTVLRDPVAAEAWIMRAIELAERTESIDAMVMLARKILGKNVFTKEEYSALEKHYRSAENDEAKYLEYLLEIGRCEQINDT